MCSPLVLGSVHSWSEGRGPSLEGRGDCKWLQSNSEERIAARRRRKRELVFEMGHSVPVKPAKALKGPTEEESEAHSTTHCPFKYWCQPCVENTSPDPQHLSTDDGEDMILVIEFDYSSAGGKGSDSEHKLSALCSLSAVEMIGSLDEYILQAFLYYIARLGLGKAKIQCDQEPSTVELSNVLSGRCQDTKLFPYSSQKGSKGSLGKGKCAYLNFRDQNYPQYYMQENEYKSAH